MNRQLAGRFRPYAFGVIAVCTMAHSLTVLAEDNDALAVARGVKGIIAADNAGDLERVIEFYADDAILILPSGPTVEGKTNIRKHYASLLGQQSLRIQNDIIETIVSGNWAISRGINHVESSSKDDAASCSSTMYLMTLRRDNTPNSWRIAHLQWNNQPALCG